MPRSLGSFIVSTCLAAGVTSAAAGAQPIAIGAEFQVNTYTTGGQARPAAAIGADGRFVVVWEGATNQDGNGYGGIFARRFNSSGGAIGTDFQVHTYTSVTQNHPAVAMAGDGRIAVVWESLRDGGGAGIFAQRYDAAGAPVASEFQVNTYTPEGQENPAVAMDSDGDFVVVWDSERQEYAVSGLGVFGRRFDSGGNPLATEFQVNTYTTGNQYEAQVAADGAGDFVVVWWSSGQDGNQRGVFGRRFDSAGTPLAAEFLANSYTSGFQDEATVAMDATGAFVVTFEGGNGSDGSSDGIFARRFDSTGAALGSQFQVNLYTSNGQFTPGVAVDGDGDFVITWYSLYQDGNSFGVFARHFDSAGAPLTSDFQVNTYTQGSQSLPAVARNADGAFVVAWGSPRDGSGDGIFARRHAVLVLAPGDVDGDTSIGPLTDGLLTIRHLFGFTGATLTSGATGANCTRCDAAAITAYLNGLGMTLDVDDNGALAALTDGLLYLRFAFGFTGNTLITGAVANDCNRCSAVDIETYLQGLI